jgi:hypothetical protein
MEKKLITIFINFHVLVEFLMKNYGKFSIAFLILRFFFKASFCSRKFHLKLTKKLHQKWNMYDFGGGVELVDGGTLVTKLTDFRLAYKKHSNQNR